MIRIFSFVLLSALAGSALAQEPAKSSSTVTLSVGGAGGGDGGPAINGNYEFRLFKYLAVEGGLDTMLPGANTYTLESVASLESGVSNYYGATGNYVTVPVYQTNRIMMVPFGFKGILPLAHDRLELFVGVGGAYIYNANYSKYSYLSPWAEQASAGARFAIDRNHRFWVGTTWRFFGDLGRSSAEATDRNWFTGTADIGFRFGH